MDETHVLQLIALYAERFPEEAATVDRVRRLVADNPRAFERDCFSPGHVTASAWIVSAESGAVLLTHHRKLDRWLQLGGHTDGETDVIASAIREAEEESGLRGFDTRSLGDRPEIFDIDVHEIPARGDEPAHEHHDLRFLLLVSESQSIVRQESESKAVRWFEPAEVFANFDEESLLRMARKAADWLPDLVEPHRA